MQLLTLFFYWARQIHKLGTANRVKICPRTRQAVYTVCNSLGTPELPLRDMVASGVATITHPDVGIQMHKPRDMRDKVPDDFWNLSEQWQVAVNRGWPPLCDFCYLCTRPPIPPDLGVRTCPLCLTSSHVQCCRLVMPTLVAHYGDVMGKPITLPHWWRVCPLCALLTGHASFT